MRYLIFELIEPNFTRRRIQSDVFLFTSARQPGAQPEFYLGGGLVEIFVRKVCEKKLFNANFVHFSHNFRNLGGGLDPH